MVTTASARTPAAMSWCEGGERAGRPRNRGINPPRTGSTGEGPSVVGFDDDAVLYGGVNAGLGFSIAGAYVQGLAYYDWY